MKEAECHCDFDRGAMKSTCQIFLTHNDVAGRKFLVCFLGIICNFRRKLFKFLLLPLLFIFSAKTKGEYCRGEADS
jgi:hypothetical protein